MAGYAATARITQGRPRFAGSIGVHSTAESIPSAPITSVVAHPRPRDRWRLGRWIEARFDAAREGWVEVTFFLFDPNSWR